MEWPTPYFTRDEFACKCGCGLDTIDYEVVSACHAIRVHFDRRVTVTNGSRCSAYNKQIGGAFRSQHKKCRAADIVVDGVPASIVQDFADENLNIGGLGRYDNFTHLDSRKGRARWNGHS